MRLSYHARNKGVENLFVSKSYVLRRLITDGVARHFLYPTGLCQASSACNWIDIALSHILDSVLLITPFRWNRASIHAAFHVHVADPITCLVAATSL